MPTLTGLRQSLASWISPNGGITNDYARAFYSMVGQAHTNYDTQLSTYILKGLLYNPTVYSVTKQRSEKSKSIPLTIKRIKDPGAKKQLDVMRYATKGAPKASQVLKMASLSAQAYEEELLDMPMEQPNPLQTWGDIRALYETFMCATGNVYLYMVTPDDDGVGEPLQLYVLPSHQIEIILKPGANLLVDETPISHYRLTYGVQAVKFPADKVIHIKLPNPTFDMNGAHLYGLSPLKPVLRNIQSSNEAIDNNIRTMLNSGSFGFIHGKNVALNRDQADNIKDRLIDMRSNTEVLSHIQGASAEIDFTRINLSPKDLMQFDFLSYDEKQVCNALGWDDKLLNNDQGAKYDNVVWAERRVLVNTIMPSLQLLQEALNKQFLTRFEAYQGAVMEFDYSEVPEMQIDFSEMVDWLGKALDRGVINRNEFRQAIKYPISNDESLDRHTVQTDVISLDEALANDLIISPMMGNE